MGLSVDEFADESAIIADDSEEAGLKMPASSSASQSLTGGEARAASKFRRRHGIAIFRLDLQQLDCTVLAACTHQQAVAGNHGDLARSKLRTAERSRP